LNKVPQHIIHLTPTKRYIFFADAIHLLRIKDWTKNLFLFLPIFFSGKMLAFAKLDGLLFGFVAFSFIASAVYIVNDYCDIEDDKKHPVKKYRCIAAGKIKPIYALYIGAILLLIGFLLALVADGSLQFLTLAILYFLMNMAYSLKLKNMAIVDVMIIALGFSIRVSVGGILTGIVVSTWLHIMVFLLSLFMALAKRRDDVLIKLKTGINIRQSVSGYSLQILNPLLIFLTFITIFAYIMYCISPITYMRLGNVHLYATSIFVIIGMLRYLQIIFIKNKAHSPTEILYKDATIQICLLLWMFSFYAILYIPNL
jgi:decaprenyl-phosphate phosphoribosyltransferase